MLCHQPKSDRPIKCDSCALVFDSLIELKSHLEQGICTHTDHMSDTTASNNDSLSALHFKTSPTLSTNGALKDGPTTHRLYPFVCETCGKAFQTYPNLRQHTISHENERKFNCHLCPKVFKRSTGLNQVRRYVFFLCMLRILFSLFFYFVVFVFFQQHCSFNFFFVLFSIARLAIRISVNGMKQLNRHSWSFFI